MRGHNHCPIENFSIVFADLDDEVPAGTIEIFILGGEAFRGLAKCQAEGVLFVKLVPPPPL